MEISYKTAIGRHQKLLYISIYFFYYCKNAALGVICFNIYLFIYRKEKTTKCESIGEIYPEDDKNIPGNIKKVTFDTAGPFIISPYNIGVIEESHGVDNKAFQDDCYIRL